MNALMLPQARPAFVPPVGMTSTMVLLQTKATRLTCIESRLVPTEESRKRFLKARDAMPAENPMLKEVIADNVPTADRHIEAITSSMRKHLESLKRGGNRKDVRSFFSLTQVAVAIQHCAAVRVDATVLAAAWNAVMDVMNRAQAEHGIQWDDAVLTLTEMEIKALDDAIDYHAAQLKCLSLAEYKKAHDLATKWDAKAVYNVLNSELKGKQCSNQAN